MLGWALSLTHGITNYQQVDDKEAMNNVDTSSSDFTILQVNCHTSQLYTQ